MTKQWPKFHKHEDAYCFNCGGDWGDKSWPMLSGFAPDHGAWFQVCNKCGVETFYDLDIVGKGAVISPEQFVAGLRRMAGGLR